MQQTRSIDTPPISSNSLKDQCNRFGESECWAGEENLTAVADRKMQQLRSTEYPSMESSNFGEFRESLQQQVSDLDEMTKKFFSDLEVGESSQHHMSNVQELSNKYFSDCDFAMTSPPQQLAHVDSRRKKYLRISDFEFDVFSEREQQGANPKDADQLGKNYFADFEFNDGAQHPVFDVRELNKYLEFKESPQVRTPQAGQLSRNYFSETELDEIQSSEQQAPGMDHVSKTYLELGESCYEHGSEADHQTKNYFLNLESHHSSLQQTASLQQESEVDRLRKRYLAGLECGESSHKQVSEVFQPSNGYFSDLEHGELSCKTVADVDHMTKKFFSDLDFAPQKQASSNANKPNRMLFSDSEIEYLSSRRIQQEEAALDSEQNGKGFQLSSPTLQVAKEVRSYRNILYDDREDEETVFRNTNCSPVAYKNLEERKPGTSKMCGSRTPSKIAFSFGGQSRFQESDWEDALSEEPTTRHHARKLSSLPSKWSLINKMLIDSGFSPLGNITASTNAEDILCDTLDDVIRQYERREILVQELLEETEESRNSEDRNNQHGQILERETELAKQKLAACEQRAELASSAAEKSFSALRKEHQRLEASYSGLLQRCSQLEHACRAKERVIRKLQEKIREGIERDEKQRTKEKELYEKLKRKVAGSQKAHGEKIESNFLLRDLKPAHIVGIYERQRAAVEAEISIVREENARLCSELCEKGQGGLSTLVLILLQGYSSIFSKRLG